MRSRSAKAFETGSRSNVEIEPADLALVLGAQVEVELLVVVNEAEAVLDEVPVVGPGEDHRGREHDERDLLLLFEALLRQGVEQQQAHLGLEDDDLDDPRDEVIHRPPLDT
jgi:hypothetical protein